MHNYIIIFLYKTLHSAFVVFQSVDFAGQSTWRDSDDFLAERTGNAM